MIPMSVAPLPPEPTFHCESGCDSRLRVAFDLRWLNSDPCGFNSYALNLLSALVLAGSEFRVVALLNPGMASLVAHHRSVRTPDFEFDYLRSSPQSPLGHFVLARSLLRRGYVILHSPLHFGVPLPSRLKVITTVHDLRPYLFPGYSPHARSARLHLAHCLALRASLRSADVIITLSNATRETIRCTFPKVESRVRVIPGAADPVFFEAQTPARVALTCRRFMLERPFILYVGRRDPYRGLVPLIRAFSQIRRRGFDVMLAVAGPNEGSYVEPEAEVRRLNLLGSVRFLGTVDLDDLRALYRRAELLAFASVFEGFGLTLLEAMASGTPVVCSALSSIPEVAGKAAIYVDPSRPESIAEGMMRVLSDPKVRTELIQRGQERARHFVWPDIARQVLQVYRHLLVAWR